MLVQINVGLGSKIEKKTFQAQDVYIRVRGFEQPFYPVNMGSW